MTTFSQKITIAGRMMVAHETRNQGEWYRFSSAFNSNNAATSSSHVSIGFAQVDFGNTTIRRDFVRRVNQGIGVRVTFS